jgi:hypothetical protein
MKQIRFFKNWNNKLDCEYFTTIRLGEKYDYYGSCTGKTFSVLLNNVEYTQACLQYVEKTTIRKIADTTITYTDAGIGCKEFLDLMTRFYKNKPSWEGMNTEIIILLFKRSN